MTIAGGNKAQNISFNTDFKYYFCSKVCEVLSYLNFGALGDKKFAMIILMGEKNPKYL